MFEPDRREERHVVTFRLTTRQLRTLDAMATARGVTRTDVIKCSLERFFRDATEPDRSDAPHPPPELTDCRISPQNRENAV